MELVTPAVGTIFWMVVIFGTVLYILKRFAWKPILSALEQREESIRDALTSAEQARLQISNLKAEQEQIRADAIRDKEQILKEARDIREQILAEAREKATTETRQMMARLREEMENEKQRALGDIRRQIADTSVMIAEKILQEQLEISSRQEEIIHGQLKDFKLN
jgi:F-type H+-transporting ATPase subunit b